MDEYLDELADFLRIPSVSAEPAHADDVRRAGEWVCEFVRRSGGEAQLVPTSTHPLALGEIPASNGKAGAPTVLLYGHFDVQPPAPLELWTSPPFDATVDGEWIVGRGIVDDKGGLYQLLKGAQLLSAEGKLPVNVRIACDGEEEVGGHSIVEFIAADERGADVCLIFDGGMERRGVPAFGVGVRGVLSYMLDIRTGERDLHSGLYGNAVLNAIHALHELLGALLPRKGRVPDELREGVSPPTAEERQAWDELKTGEEMIAQGGARPYDDSAAEEFYVRTTAEPSFELNGVLGGKPGLQNTTIPAVAQANFTVRLAPGQDVETIDGAVRELLRGAAPPGAEVDLRLVSSAPPGLVAPDSPAIRIAQDVFERTVGRRPLLARSGGTLPIVPALVESGIPPILAGFGLLESNVHSPNERMLAEYLPLGVETARELYLAFGELR
ncbi:MAG: M20/M25/M40 family metallo-hydrolase [Actinobacteria bacterium]|nr:M20/M25/M40 family metallo-hydrolase [Actinomycetota bacterium]